MITVLLAGQLTWNIPLFLLTIVISVVYIVYIRQHQTDIKRLQPVLFLLGIWLLFGILGSPLLAFSYLSFSFHMIQMSLLFFIIPPLLLLGIPESLYRKIISLPFMKEMKSKFISPKFALILFAILFLFYHLPFLLAFISQYSLLQKTYLTILFLLSFRMFWPIASPNPNQRFITAKRKKYIWQSSVYIMPACMMFIISALLDNMSNPFLGEVVAHLCLPADSTIQILPPPFNTKYDQMMAGAFMIVLHKLGLMMTCQLEEKC